MLITHEQARKLIQFDIDQALNRQEAALLSAHLRECRDCAAYASELKGVEKILLPAMKKRWHAQPAPLSVSVLLEKQAKVQTNTFLTMRRAAASLVILALFFGAWRFLLSSPFSSSQVPPAVPLVPTPSVHMAQSTRTQLTQEACRSRLYSVQTGDTLASIARQFSVSEDMILEFNRLERGNIRPAMKLVIPVCPFTPTGTFTITYTPIVDGTTSTPGG